MQKSLRKKQREVQKLLENVYIITIEDILWKIYKIKRKSSITFAHELVLHFVNANNLNSLSILYLFSRRPTTTHR